MDPKLLALIKSVTDKRPKIVLDHILEHGSISTDELREQYGYDHAPRAARDVREWGIRLTTTMTRTADGRRMAVYRIDETTDADAGKAGGRRAFPKTLKITLAARDGEQCALCGGRFPARALQIDHCIPYEIMGEPDRIDPDEFMLVCGSCNRAKSWSCEHCPNWIAKDDEACSTCMWASPSLYSHIAMEPRRRLELVWEGDDVGDYDEVAAVAEGAGEDVRTLVKAIIRRSLREDPAG